jgi:hypothetical protein
MIKRIVIVGYVVLSLMLGYLFQEGRAIAMYNDNRAYLEGSAPDR